MNRIQKSCVFTFLFFLSFTVIAQETEKPKPIQDKIQKEKTAVEEAPVLSPPSTYTATLGDAEITLNYGAPSVRGRDIWGDLVPFGKLWRTGANASTSIDISKDILVEGQALAAGSYSLFTIPDEDNWTIIFNSNPKQWGHYDYDETKDVLRVQVTPLANEELVETFTLEVEEIENGGQLVMKWEKLIIPITLAPVAH